MDITFESEVMGQTILLAEDEPSLRTLVATILYEEGFLVLESCNGEEALLIADQLNGKEISLLLSDIVMPQMDGIELYEQFRTKYPETPVLLMSGFTGHNLPTNSGKDNNVAFLSKPFSITKLADKVRIALSPCV